MTVRAPRQTVITIPDACENCTADDCYHGTSKCPQYQGNPVGRPLIHSDLYPAVYKDKAEYNRIYSRNYRRKFGRVMVPVKLRKCDLETLRTFFEGHGETFESKLTLLLEQMADAARERR